ncbi:hypothetical protein [Paenibacillus gallinarum]|nr:hypothetical protein [Paenibacillus gallinarum]
MRQHIQLSETEHSEEPHDQKYLDAFWAGAIWGVQTNGSSTA